MSFSECLYAVRFTSSEPNEGNSERLDLLYKITLLSLINGLLARRRPKSHSLHVKCVAYAYSTLFESRRHVQIQSESGLLRHCQCKPTAWRKSRQAQKQGRRKSRISPPLRFSATFSTASFISSLRFLPHVLRRFPFLLRHFPRSARLTFLRVLSPLLLHLLRCLVKLG